MKAYEVGAKCGHVGRNYYVEKVFAIRAGSGKEAAALARRIPRVKHDRPDAIIFVNEIDWDRYEEICRANDADPYFSCASIQEQRLICSVDRRPEYYDDDEYEPQRSYPAFYVGKIRVRNPKKYMTRMTGGDAFYEAA